MRKEKTYALYVEGEQKGFGTLKELSKMTGIKTSTLYNRAKPHFKNQVNSYLTVSNLGDGDFVLYKGEELLIIGTIEELMQYQGVKRSTILFYAAPSYKARMEENKTKNYYLEEIEC